VSGRGCWRGGARGRGAARRTRGSAGSGGEAAPVRPPRPAERGAPVPGRIEPGLDDPGRGSDPGAGERRVRGGVREGRRAGGGGAGALAPVRGGAGRRGTRARGDAARRGGGVGAGCGDRAGAEGLRLAAGAAWAGAGGRGDERADALLPGGGRRAGNGGGEAGGGAGDRKGGV